MIAFFFFSNGLTSHFNVFLGGKLSLLAQVVKNLSAMREAWIQYLDWGDPQEKEIATHSSILAWKIPLTEEAGGLQFTGLQRVEHD